MAHSVLFVVLLTLVGCSAGAKGPQSPPLSEPRVSGTFIGLQEPVFDTKTACEQIDVPDAPARAFRDDRNVVHLIASHYIARAMVGPNLTNVKHDCKVIYRSPKDPDPADFQDNNWLYSFYTSDGRRVAALVHSEYDADEIPGKCATPEDPNNCWWNTVTFAQSVDGGYSFSVPAAPGNLVAAIPYAYEIGNRASAYGYNEPSNILKIGLFYYALINDWPYKAQKYGSCLIRTSDVFDPGSWRAWDGKNFTVHFADPYRDKIARPEEHVCEPVLEGSVSGLVQSAASGTFVVIQLAPDRRFGPPGFYLQGSLDLIHWSKPTLLAEIGNLQLTEGPGNWTYDYVSLLDPTSTDRNFSTVSDTPYVYYVRFDADRSPYARVLFRRQVRLSLRPH